MSLALVSDEVTPEAPAQAEPAAPRAACNRALCLTPHAFVPAPCPGYESETRWVRVWALNPRKAMEALCLRLARPAAALVVVDRPESDDVEIHGLLNGYDKLVPLALVAHGLTAGDCVAGLQDLVGTPS